MREPGPSQARSGYRATVLEAGDFPGVEALFNAVFPWKPVPAGFASWRYASGGVKGFCVGVHDRTGTLVGSQGIQILPASDGAVVGLSVDVMVHPGYQRQGLGALMDECARGEAERSCTALLCFPNPKLAGLRAKDVRWREAARARAYRAGCESTDRAGPGGTWRVVHGVPDGIEALWETLRTRSPGAAGILRTTDYLTWRFDQNPLHSYDWIVRDARGGRDAAAAIKIWIDSIDGSRSGDVVELLALDRPASIAALRAARAHLCSRGVSKVTFWAPCTVSDEDLTAAGFVPDPPLSRVLQAQSLRGPDLDFSRWYLTQSDTDLY